MTTVHQYCIFCINAVLLNPAHTSQFDLYVKYATSISNYPYIVSRVQDVFLCYDNTIHKCVNNLHRPLHVSRMSLGNLSIFIMYVTKIAYLRLFVV